MRVSRFFEWISVIVLFLALSLLYLFPLIYGLIPLALDLLVSNYGPWLSANTIFIKNPYMQDSIVQYFPWRHLVYESLTSGVIPLWNPYQFMGGPFLAMLKPMIFYPTNIFFLFGEVQSWNLLLISQLFLGMIFSYLLARDLELPPYASIFVALSFSLNSLMISVLQFGQEGHVLIWFPLVVYFIKRYIDKQHGRYLLGFGISVACCLLAGQLQYFSYGMILFGIFTLGYWLYKKSSITTLIFLLLSGMVGVGIASIQLLPSIELFRHSFRGIADSYTIFSTSLMPPHHIFRLFAPDLFGNPITKDATIGYIEHSGYFGIIAFFFCLYAMQYVRSSVPIRIFTIIFFVGYGLSMQGIGQLLYYLHIPLMTSGYGERIFLLVLISGSILAGYGLKAFVDDAKHIKKNALSLLLFSVTFILVVITAVVFKDITGTTTVLVNTKFPLMVLGGFLFVCVFYLLFQRKNTWIRYGFIIAILALSFLDLFRFGYRFITFSNEKFLYPQLPVISYLQKNSAATLGRTFGLTEPEIATYLRIPTVETYNPLYIMRVGEVIHALLGKASSSLPMNKFLLTGEEGPRLKYALDFLGVEYIVSKKDSNPAVQYFKSLDYEKSLMNIYQDDDYIVFKNKDVIPRFGTYYKYKVVEDDKEELDVFQNKSVDFHDTVLLNTPPSNTVQVGTGSSRLIRSTIQSQEFEVQSTTPGIFYISDTYFPGWKATINEEPLKILRANSAFRAVEVPSGVSQIKFWYDPDSVRLGALFTFISGIALIVLASSHSYIRGIGTVFPGRKRNERR